MICAEAVEPHETTAHLSGLSGLVGLLRDKVGGSCKAKLILGISVVGVGGWNGHAMHFCEPG